MALTASSTVSDALIEACIELVGQGAQLRDLTVRSITHRAGVSLSAVSYHFGSLDELIAVVAQRVYARINLRRVELFQQAVERSQPEPPPLRDVLDALIRPTVGKRPEIRFLQQIGSLLSKPASPELTKLDNEMAPHQIIVDSLLARAPWLSRAEIGWRVHAILGIRTHVQRRESRMRVLSDDRLDLDDPEVVIGIILDIAVPMFAAPGPDTTPLLRF
ncbi:MAG: TetR/AcrR family transcriptional regulator [Pararhodobacter sp.]